VTATADWAAYDNRYPNLQYCCATSTPVVDADLTRSGWGWHGSLPAGVFGSGSKGNCDKGYSRQGPAAPATVTRAAPVTAAPTAAPRPAPVDAAAACRSKGGFVTATADWAAYDNRYPNLQYCCATSTPVVDADLTRSGWSWHGSLPAGVFGSGSKGNCDKGYSRSG